MRLSRAAAPVAIIVTALLLGPATAHGQQASRSAPEASGSFNLEDIEPFLSKIAALVDSGLTAADIRAMADEIAKLPVGAQKEYRYNIKTKGGRASLRIGVVVDDDDAADLTFSTADDLTRRIDEAMGQFFEDMEEE